MEESPPRGGKNSRGPLRVLMIIQRFRPYFSGHGIQVEELCKALARRGVTTTILTAARAELPRHERMGGYSVERLRCDLPGVRSALSRSWSPLFALRTLGYLWRHRSEIDVVHVHALTDALYAARLFGRACGVPVLFEMTLVGADDPASVRQTQSLFRRLRYAAYSRCDGYVAISPALARRYREAALPAERLRVIPQGVDLERFSPAADRYALRARLGLPAEGALLVFVGSLTARKGLDVLLGAWEQIFARRPDARLLLLGPDRFPEDPAAERFVRECLGRLSTAAAANVTCAGTQDSPEGFLRCADVFLFPSRSEGFGTAIVEAMACGLPAVVAELPDITDFIFTSPCRGPEPRAGCDGIVVPQEDPAALARAAIALLDARDAAAAIGSAARARAETAFGFATITADYLETYSALLGSTGAGVRSGCAY